jgi:tripartite-type tricarboxylate transporter receptor subunit TctC
METNTSATRCAASLRGLPGIVALIVAALWSVATPKFAMASALAEADHYPDKPIRIVVPYEPGGGTDILARLINVGLSKRFGQTGIIDNRPGAATAVGTQIVARAPADGLTILITTGTFAVLPALYPKLSFDPVRDFEGVTLFASSPNVLLVNPSVPAKNLKEFLVYAAQKARTDPLNYGSSGNGGTGHLSMELLKQMTGLKMVHIPFKGGAPAMNALLSGVVSAMINNVAAAVPQIKAGNVRALGITTPTRSAALPDVPTIAEAGLPGFDASAWFGVLVPAKTPAAIAKKLSLEINEIVESPEVRKAMAAQGVDVVGNTPAQFNDVIRQDVARWRRVVQTAHIQAD